MTNDEFNSDLELCKKDIKKFKDDIKSFKEVYSELLDVVYAYFEVLYPLLMKLRNNEELPKDLTSMVKSFKEKYNNFLIETENKEKYFGYSPRELHSDNLKTKFLFERLSRIYNFYYYLQIDQRDILRRIDSLITATKDKTQLEKLHNQVENEFFKENMIEPQFFKETLLTYVVYIVAAANARSGTIDNKNDMNEFIKLANMIAEFTDIDVDELYNDNWRESQMRILGVSKKDLSLKNFDLSRKEDVERCFKLYPLAKRYPDLFNGWYKKVDTPKAGHICSIKLKHATIYGLRECKYTEKRHGDMLIDQKQLNDLVEKNKSGKLKRAILKVFNKSSKKTAESATVPTKSR